MTLYGPPKIVYLNDRQRRLMEEAQRKGYLIMEPRRDPPLESAFYRWACGSPIPPIYCTATPNRGIFKCDPLGWDTHHGWEIRKRMIDAFKVPSRWVDDGTDGYYSFRVKDKRCLPEICEAFRGSFRKVEAAAA